MSDKRDFNVLETTNIVVREKSSFSVCQLVKTFYSHFSSSNEGNLMSRHHPTNFYYYFNIGKKKKKSHKKLSRKTKLMAF